MRIDIIYNYLMALISYRLGKTTIVIETETRNLLKQIARKNQTYDQLINGLIEQNRKENQDSSGHRVETLISPNSNIPRGSIISSNQKGIPEVKSICEAIGCNAEAITEIQIEAGQAGSITLSLCGNCVNKFRDLTQLYKTEGPSGEKKFEAGKQTSYNIDTQLNKGNNIPTILRKSEGLIQSTKLVRRNNRGSGVE